MVGLHTYADVAHIALMAGNPGIATLTPFIYAIKGLDDVSAALE